MSDDEEWRAISAHPGYEVSSRGRVRNARTFRVLSQQLDRDGRPSLLLSAPGGCTRRRVHLLVAEAFHGPRPEGLLTRHLNDDRCDNRAVNLAYGTKLDNWQDAVTNGVPGIGVPTASCPRGHAHVPPNRTATQWCVACDRARGQIQSDVRAGRQPRDLQEAADLAYAKLMGSPT